MHVLSQRFDLIVPRAVIVPGQQALDLLIPELDVGICDRLPLDVDGAEPPPPACASPYSMSPSQSGAKV